MSWIDSGIHTKSAALREMILVNRESCRVSIDERHAIGNASTFQPRPLRLNLETESAR